MMWATWTRLFTLLIDIYKKSITLSSMKNPDKNARYVLNVGGNGTLWEIWELEDFSDGQVLLYETESGEDYTISLEKFHQYFTAI